MDEKEVEACPLMGTIFLVIPMDYNVAQSHSFSVFTGNSVNEAECGVIFIR